MNILRVNKNQTVRVSDRIRNLTARALENGVKWEVVKEVCQLIMNDASGDHVAKESLEALKVWVKSKHPPDQIAALQMLHALVKNCDSRFVSNLATKKWMERLVKIVKLTNDPHVRGIILQLIAEWWHDHKRNPQLVYFGKAAETLVQRGYTLPVINRPPDAGKVSASGSRRNSVGRSEKTMPKPQLSAASLKPDENPTLTNLRKGLTALKVDIKWLKEALDQDVRDLPEGIPQVVEVCSEWQKRIQSLLNSEAPEELTMELLELNDDIVLILKKWERVKVQREQAENSLDPAFDELANRHNDSAVKVEDIDVDFDPEFDSDDENINDLLAMRSSSSSKATLAYRRHVQDAILKTHRNAQNLRQACAGVRTGMVKMTQGFNHMCVALVNKIGEFDGPVGSSGGGGGGGGGGASNAEVFALKTKIQELERQIADESKSNDQESQLKIEKLESEVAILKERIKALEAERDELEAKFETDIGEKIDKVNAQLEQEQQEKQAMESELKAMSGRLENAIADLDARDELHKKTLETAVERYRAEAVKRRQLYNQLQELKGNIRVIARIRPLVRKEKESGEETSVTFPDPYSLDIYNQATSSNKRYEFDRVFDSSSTQEMVFEEVQPLVVSILDGYNVCIFAYGQTGAGKTFTMDGDESHPGLNRNSVSEMFKLASESEGKMEYKFEVSMLEVYNEEIADLLAKEKVKLDVKQDAKKKVFVDKLTWRPVGTAEEALAALTEGLGNRRSRCTNMNEHSSRSHMVFSVRVNVSNKMTGVNLVGTLYLVDLAGSERVAKSGVTGQAFTEAANINKSLSALGDVIKSLTAKQAHCPYRNSKLTYLLQDAIGGDAKTLMFVNCSPAFSNIQESISSLNFASRVRTVEKGQASRQGDTEEVIRLKTRVKELEAKLEAK